MLQNIMKKIELVDNNNQFIITTYSLELLDFEMFNDRSMLFIVTIKNLCIDFPTLQLYLKYLFIRVYLKLDIFCYNVVIFDYA